MEKNKKMMVVIISLLVVLLAVIIGVAVFAFRTLSAEKQEVPEINTTQNVSIKEAIEIKFNESINVNLREGDDGRDDHIVRVNLSMYVDRSNKDDEELIAKMQESDTIMKDATITVLSSKTIEELKDPDALEIIKQEILNRLQDEYQTNIIYKVLFNDFVYAYNDIDRDYFLVA